MDDFMSGRDGPENLRILKRVSWDLRLDDGGRELSTCHWVENWEWVIEDVIKFFQISTEKDLKHHEMCRTLRLGLAYYDYERLLRIVSLSTGWRTEVRINKPFVPEQQCRPAFVFACFRICICIMIMAIQHLGLNPGLLSHWWTL